VFFRKKSNPDTGVGIDAAVAAALPDADGDTRRIVTALVGLCGVVAYADRDFSATEQESLRRLLGGIQGMTHTSAARVVSALQDEIVAISSTELAREARTLMELADRDLRVHTLELLLELAAADDTIAQQEVVVLRQVTKALGLEQSDYNRLQAKHRALLASLH
jgi:uncharacterized tellurite resistance protein B-like protein